jgi:hypothetical protein
MQADTACRLTATATGTTAGTAAAAGRRTAAAMKEASEAVQVLAPHRDGIGNGGGEDTTVAAEGVKPARPAAAAAAADTTTAAAAVELPLVHHRQADQADQADNSVHAPSPSSCGDRVEAKALELEGDSRAKRAARVRQQKTDAALQEIEFLKYMQRQQTTARREANQPSGSQGRESEPARISEGAYDSSDASSQRAGRAVGRPSKLTVTEHALPSFDCNAHSTAHLGSETDDADRRAEPHRRRCRLSWRGVTR